MAICGEKAKKKKKGLTIEKTTININTNCIVFYEGVRQSLKAARRHGAQQRHQLQTMTAKVPNISEV